MRQKKFYLSLMIIAIIFLGGCFAKEGPAATSPLDTVKGMKEAADLGKAIQEGNEKDTQKALENLAQVGANMEVAEFEKTQAVDRPEKFPAELIYTSGKITSAGDNSSDDQNLSLDMEIKTLDELQKVKDFYKNALTGNWKISSQKNQSESASLEARNEDGHATANIEMERSQYSKITRININYYTNQ